MTGRPKLPEELKKKRINIMLNKSVYKNLKNRGLNISSTINMLLSGYLQSNVGENTENLNCDRRGSNPGHWLGRPRSYR